VISGMFELLKGKYPLAWHIHATDIGQVRDKHVFAMFSCANGIAPGFPKPPTEYDSYIGTVYSMLLDERTNHRRIANHLLNIAIRSMGLSDGPELRERCVSPLLR